MARVNQAPLAQSDSALIKCQLYLMQFLPGFMLRLFAQWTKRGMKKAANAIEL